VKARTQDDTRHQSGICGRKLQQALRDRAIVGTERLTQRVHDPQRPPRTPSIRGAQPLQKGEPEVDVHHAAREPAIAAELPAIADIDDGQDDASKTRCLLVV
jgi:hypothetical protein